MTNEARVLRELRIQSGLSMRRAGELLGCTDSYISHIENGRSDVPTGERLDKFLIAYGGMKQKSFYERVRNYHCRISPTEELIEAVSCLPADKIKILIQLAKTI
jgi:transcriptional regulator with XRE-family HTH domain